MTVERHSEAELNAASKYQLKEWFEELRGEVSKASKAHTAALDSYQTTLKAFEQVFIKVEMIDQIVEKLVLVTDPGEDVIDNIWGLFGAEEIGTIGGLVVGGATSVASFVAAIYRLGQPLKSASELAGMSKWAKFRHGPTAKWLGFGGAVFGVVTAGIAIGLTINANNVLKAHYRELIPQYETWLNEIDEATGALRGATTDMQDTLDNFMEDVGIVYDKDDPDTALETLKGYLGDVLRKVGEASALVDTATRILCRNKTAPLEDVVSPEQIVAFTGLSASFVAKRKEQVEASGSTLCDGFAAMHDSIAARSQVPA